MNQLPPRVESYIMQQFPDMTPSVRHQLLRYTYADREDVLMEVLYQGKESLRTLSCLITQRLDTQPRITVDDLVAQLSKSLPDPVARYVAEYFPQTSINVKRQLLRYTREDREEVMLEILEKSKRSLWILTQLMSRKLDPSFPEIKDQPRRHYSQYGEYESDRLFTTLRISIQNMFDEVDWAEAERLISPLLLDDRQKQRLIRDSYGQIETLREQAKRAAALPQAPQADVSTVSTQQQLDLLKAIDTYFFTQKDKVAVRKLLGRYPDHKNAYVEIVNKSGGDWSTLQGLLKSWQDDEAVDLGSADMTKASETRLEQAIERFFPHRKPDVMEVLNRYHGKNATAIRAQLVERSGGSFLDLLIMLDQRLFPVPEPYRPPRPANGPDWLDWVGRGDPRDVFMALTPEQAEVMKTAYEARIAEGDAAYKAAARAVVPPAVQELVAAQIQSPAQQEQLLTAFENYPFGSTNHRSAAFRAILQQSQEPQQVLEMVLYQKIGLRMYGE